MKLQMKHREGYKVQRIYDSAKTPFHRQLGEAVLTQKKRQQLEKIFSSLDPIRLLKQIRNMQDALCMSGFVVQTGQHAVIETTEHSKPVSHVTFNLDIGALPKNDNIGTSAAEKVPLNMCGMKSVPGLKNILSEHRNPFLLNFSNVVLISTKTVNFARCNDVLNSGVRRRY